MKEQLILWLLAAMNSWAPAHRVHYVPEAQESYEQADARYLEIATAVVNVAFDTDEKPLFGGRNARSQTALFVAYKWFMESGFRRDIQTGAGRERYAGTGLNDYGRSWCFGQINLGMKLYQVGEGKWRYDSATTTPEGWTGRELLEDIGKCAKTTLHTLHRTMASCSRLPFDQRLAAYAAGSCDSRRGQEISESRMRYFRSHWGRAYAKHPKMQDKDLLAQFAAAAGTDGAATSASTLLAP
jgi:hypothetical protein